MITIPTYVKSVLKTFGAVGQTAVDVVTDGLLTAIDSCGDHDNRLFRADWGNPRDLLSSSNTGFCLTGTSDGCISRHTSYENVMVTGGIGSGKTASIVINNVLRLENASMIINCPSGQTRAVVASYLASKNVPIEILRFDDPYNAGSFNVFDFVLTKNECFILAYALSAQLDPGSGDNFWLQQTRTLLMLLVSILIKQDRIYRNGANLKALLHKFATRPESLDRLFVKYADDDLLEDYKAIISLDEKVLKSIVASTQAALQLWFDDAVCKSTSVNTIDFAKLRETPCCIFIETPTQNSRMYAPLISLFFEFAFRSLMSSLPKKDDLDVFIIIDECSSLRVNSLGDILNNNRKYRCPIMTLWQSQSQIETAFGVAEAESIRNASRTKVFLGPQGLKTSHELEDMLGKTEAIGANGKRTVGPLMPSHDILNMRADEAIIFSPGSNPLRIRVTPYFQQPFLRAKVALPPYRYRNTRIPKTVPILKLDEADKTK